MILHTAKFHMQISNEFVTGLDLFEPTCGKDHIDL